ncbi:MAG: DUF58 domain-containing protein [Clostridia bacterium]|nr:DUF58 domain-containing protein [Clostridia bacterium]
MSVLSILSVFFALYILWGILISRFGLKGLSCTRAFSKPAFFEGEDGEMIEVVRNDRLMLIPWLRVESRIPAALQLGRQDNLLVSDRTHACSLFTLMPFQQIRRRHKVRFARRGAYNLGKATLTAGDILNAFQTSLEQDMDVPVLVYPRLLEEGEIPEPLFQLMGDIVSRRNLLSDPFLIRGIRPYQIGDSVRDIHWPATARTGDVQVRVHDHTAQPRLLVVLNSQRKDGQWSDRLMDYEEGEIEHEIALAATLCIRALRAGLCAGFAANMPLDKEIPESTILLPEGGAAREEELLAAFARLCILRTDSYHELLSSLCGCSGLCILALSCYTNERIEAALSALRRSGNHAELCLLGGGAA